MVVTLGQQNNTGEKPTVILLSTFINRYAGTLLINKTRMKGMISLDYNSICKIESRIGWVDMISYCT